MLEAHERYWRKTPSVKTLVFRVIPDESTRLAALKRGEIDIAYSIRGELAEEVRRTPGLTLKPARSRSTLWLVFADQGDPKSPWADRRVRLAANLAINRPGDQPGGLSRASASSRQHHPADARVLLGRRRPVYDPPAARRLLAEAGHPQGFDGGDLSRPFAASGIGEPVLNDLKAVGIRLRLRPVERAAFLKQYGDKSLRNVILAGSGAPGTAATRLEQYVISGGLYTYTSVPEVDGLYNAQANEGNPRARRVILEKMQQIIHDRVLFGPVLEYAYLVSIGPRLEVDNLNVLPQNPYTAPYEELRLRAR